MKILKCSITAEEKKDLEYIYRERKCPERGCDYCPMDEVSCGHKIQGDNGMPVEQAKHILSVAEVEFEPYSVEVWVHGMPKHYDHNNDAGFQTMLLGPMTVWNKTKTEACNHKFKLTVEKVK